MTLQYVKTKLRPRQPSELTVSKSGSDILHEERNPCILSKGEDQKGGGDKHPGTIEKWNWTAIKATQEMWCETDNHD